MKGPWIAALAILAAVAVGLVGYNIGLMQHVAMADQMGASIAYREGGWYGPHVGFGFLGFFFPLLLIFLLIGALRGPFWGGRGRWGDGPERLEEWHRRAHEESMRKPD